MVNIISLAVTHLLMALAALVLFARDDLDEEDALPGSLPRWRRQRAADADLPPDGEAGQ